MHKTLCQDEKFGEVKIARQKKNSVGFKVDLPQTSQRFYSQKGRLEIKHYLVKLSSYRNDNIKEKPNYHSFEESLLLAFLLEIDQF